MRQTLDQARAPASSAGAARCHVTSRGPNWLFVTVEAPFRVSGLADRLWEIAAGQFVYRMVVDFSEGNGQVDSARLAEELRCLRGRLEEHGGMLRLCGLQAEVASAVHAEAGCSNLQCHPTTYEAVWGDRSEEETVEDFPRYRPR